jgi:hypothetical protein
MRHRFRVTLSLLMLFASGICLQAQTSYPSDRKVGEIFVAIGNGKYQVWDFSGAMPTLAETITDGAGNGNTAGCAFNSTYHPLTTNVANNNVFKDMIIDPQTAIQTINVQSAGGAQPTSIAFDSAGNAYVGVASGNGLIEEYGPSGALVKTLPVQKNNLTIGSHLGSAWMDLSQDGTRIYFTNGSNAINQFAVSSSNVSSFQTITGATLGGLRVLTPAAQSATTGIPNGPGVLLVAAVFEGSSNIQLLNQSGTTIMTYVASNENNFQVLTLDPDGRTFWAGNPTTNNFYRFDLATGSIKAQANTGTGPGTGPMGLCGYGGFSAAQLPSITLPSGQTVPQPISVSAALTPSSSLCSVNSVTKTMSCTFSTVLPPPSSPEACPTTVTAEPSNNCFGITVHGINLNQAPNGLELTYNYSQISQAAGTSDTVLEPNGSETSPLLCDLTTSAGTGCEVHSIDLNPDNSSGQTNIYSSFDLEFFSTSTAPTIVNPRVVRDGNLDVTASVIKDLRVGGSGNSVFTTNELPLPTMNGATAQSCGYTPPLINSTYKAGRTIPFKFQAVAAGVSCSAGPYLGTGTLKPRLVLLQLSANGATAGPVSYTLSNRTVCPATTGCYYNLDPTSNTWILNLKTSGLTGGGTVYFGTTFDDDNQIPPFSNTASGAAVAAFTLK